MEPPYKKRKLNLPNTFSKKKKVKYAKSKLASFRQNDSLTVKFSILNGEPQGAMNDDYSKISYKTSSRYCHVEVKIDFDFLKLMDKFFYYSSFYPFENPLIKNNMGKPSKNIMEATYTVYHFCKYLKRNTIDIKTMNKIFLEVGSGTIPQVCPLLFHLNSNEKTTYVSVDPILNDEGARDSILLFPKKVEDIDVDTLTLEKDLVVVFSVHGHANMQNLWNRLKDKKLIFVVVPCCKKFVNLPEGKAVYHKKELAIPSQKDSVYIFTNF